MGFPNFNVHIMTRGCYLPVGSDSAGPGWALRFCTFNESPGCCKGLKQHCPTELCAVMKTSYIDTVRYTCGGWAPAMASVAEKLSVLSQATILDSTVLECTWLQDERHQCPERWHVRQESRITPNSWPEQDLCGVGSCENPMRRFVGCHLSCGSIFTQGREADTSRHPGD